MGSGAVWPSQTGIPGDEAAVVPNEPKNLLKLLLGIGSWTSL